MRGGDDQRPMLPLRVIIDITLEVIGFGQNAAGVRQHLATGFGHPGQSFTDALENNDAQIVFQLFDLLRHAGLRGKQRLSGFGHIESTLRDLDQVTELLQRHGSPLLIPYSYSILTIYSFMLDCVLLAWRPL